MAWNEEKENDRQSRLTRVSTSFVERQNLRMSMRRMTRMTNGLPIMWGGEEIAALVH